MTPVARCPAPARGAATAALLALAAGLLSGCGGEEPVTPDSGSSGDVDPVTVDADGVQHVTLQTQDDYLFTPDRFEVEPGPVRLTVRNVAEEMVHNFRFTPGGGPEDIGAEIDLLTAGQEMTIEFEVTEPGEYPFECTFHVQLDQVGTMTVAG